MKVFEMTRQLPRFCMYQIIEKPQQIPDDFTKNSVTAEVYLFYRINNKKYIISFFRKKIINKSINISAQLARRKTSKNRPLVEPKPHPS